MPPVRAVIFDLDDTLMDHRSAADAAIWRWIDSLTGAPTDALVAAWLDAENRHVAAWSRGEVGFDEQRRRRVREVLLVAGLEAGIDDAQADTLYADYLRRYESGWRAFEDVVPAIAAVADAGLPLAILTNGADHQQRQKLTAIGLAELIDRLHCCDVIGAAKPDPRAYQFVCDWLGVAPENVLHVGDRHDYDVVGARDAGLQAVHLDRPGTGPADEPLRIRSLAALPALLGSTLSATEPL